MVMSYVAEREAFQTVCCPPTEADGLLSRFKLEVAAESHFILKQDQCCQNLGFIEQGLVRVFSDVAGKEVTP